MALTLNEFKIGDEFIKTYLSFREIKHLFDQNYRDIYAPSTDTRLAWFVDFLVSREKAERLPCPMADITTKLLCT